MLLKYFAAEYAILVVENSGELSEEDYIVLRF